MSEADEQFPDNHIGTIKPERLRTFTKYLLAAYDRVHMDDDDEGLGDLTPLSGGASQADANARAEELRVAMLAHCESVGTPSVDGDHLAEDSINADVLSAIPTLTSLSDLPTCITLVNGLNTALLRHNTQPGVHFHDSVSTIGTPNFPLAHCSVEITAVMDGMGGTAFSFETVNVSGGVEVGELIDTNLPSFLTLGLTLPVEVAQDLRVSNVTLRMITADDPPASIEIAPFLPYTFLIASGDDQVIIAIPLTSSPDAPVTRIIGLTYILSIASTPSAAGMSIEVPTTLGHVITDLNDLLDSYMVHFADA